MGKVIENHGHRPKPFVHGLSRLCSQPVVGQYAVLILFVSCYSQAFAQMARTLTAPEKQVLLKQIETVERVRVVNLMVESELWVETRKSLADPCEPWV